MTHSGKFSHLGFILATAGSAVGLGNVIRFPFVMGESGGGAFFAIYLLTILFIGASIMLTEMVIGYKGVAGAPTSMEKLAKKSPKLWKNLGWVMSGSSNIIFSYYIILLSWIMGYIWLSFTGSLAHDPSEAITIFKHIQSDVLSMFILGGSIFILSFIVVAKGITNGIERLNLVLMPAILVIFTSMMLYAYTLEGFDQAFVFMFHVDWSALTSKVVISAVGMSFFTLSLGSAIVLAYSASLPKGTNLVRSIAYVVLLDTAIAIVSGLMIFSFYLWWKSLCRLWFGIYYAGKCFFQPGYIWPRTGTCLFQCLALCRSNLFSFND